MHAFVCPLIISLQEVDDDLNGSLDFDEFVNLFKDMATRQELWNLFIKYV